MPYGFEEPDDDILLRLQQILEPDKVRQLREAQAVPDTQEAVQSRARENEINQAWKKELFPERRADTWQGRASKVLHAASQRLMAPRDWGDGNEWLGAVAEGANAYRQAADDEETGQQADAKTKLAALISGAGVASRAEKNSLAQENMLLKYGNLDRNTDLKEQALDLKRQDLLRRSDERRKEYNLRADNLKIRLAQLNLSSEAGKRAALALFTETKKAMLFELGLDDPINKIGSPEEEASRRRDFEGFVSKLKNDPQFSFLFQDEGGVVAPDVSRGTFGREDRADTGTNPDWDLTQTVYNKKTGQKLVLNRRTHTWDPM